DLGRRAAQLAHLFALAPEEMREIGRGQELPAPAALDQLHPAVAIMRLELAQRGADVGLAQVRRERIRAHRLLGGEKRRLDRANEGGERFAHAGIRRRWSGPKISSCRISALPRRASSSAARKLEASAERLSRGSAPTGRKSRSSIQSSFTPSSAETRSIAESSVITIRSRTMCTTGSVRAFTVA